MNFDANWQKAATQMQEAFKGMMQPTSGGVPGFPQSPSLPSIQFDAAKLQQIQQNYIEGATALWNQSLQAGGATLLNDARKFFG